MKQKSGKQRGKFEALGEELEQKFAEIDLAIESQETGAAGNGNRNLNNGINGT